MTFNSVMLDMGSIVAHGPEYFECGKARHSRAIQNLATDYEVMQQPTFKILVCLVAGGQLNETNVWPGVQSVDYSANERTCRVRIGIPLSLLRSDDEAYRVIFSEYLCDAARKVVNVIERKRLEIDGQWVLNLIDAVVYNYRNLQMPLPRDPMEDSIKSWHTMRHLLDDPGSHTTDEIMNITFYAYFPSRQMARSLKLCHEPPFTCEVAKSENEWLCRIECSKSSSDFPKLKSEVERLVNESGGVLDGWEID